MTQYDVVCHTGFYLGGGGGEKYSRGSGGTGLQTLKGICIN